MVSRSVRRFVDDARIRVALRRAENVTSASIHVSIAPYFWGDVLRTAERAFRRHHLDRTRDRNGVLLFCVPSRREFAIVADSGAQERLGQDAWDALARSLEEDLRGDDPTPAFERAIERLANRLAASYPARATRAGGEHS